MERAAVAAWGDPSEIESLAIGALEDYRQVYESEERCSTKGLTAILLATRLYQRDFLFNSVVTDSRQRARSLLEELAQRLVTCFQNHPDRTGFLVRGVIVETDLVHRFEAQLTEHEVDWSITTGDRSMLRLRLPSAFTLLNYLGDYELANQVVDLCPDAFTTPGLRGWRSVVQGLARPELAAERFAEAADAFAEDRYPESDEELQRRGGHWDNLNVDTWAPHFRVRSLLATAARERESSRIRELIARAATFADPQAGGRLAPTVRRLSILVRALAGLLGSEPSVDVQAVKNEFLLLTNLGMPDANDEATVQFLTLATQALDGFANNPVIELSTGPLSVALNILRRLLLEPGLPDAIGPIMVENAFHLALGPIRTWMHRTLESITDERQLRQFIYRLCQASHPRYTQLLHGPLEFGKDIVVYFERDGLCILRMYQAKVGDISLRDWHNVRSQLEDVFLVPLPDFVVPADPKPRLEGILICNGHASPHASPAMEGWFETQRGQLGRDFRFMGLDDIVQWIEHERLVNEFRTALRELGIPVQLD
jgi:hypothetical protein